MELHILEVINRLSLKLFGDDVMCHINNMFSANTTPREFPWTTFRCRNECNAIYVTNIIVLTLFFFAMYFISKGKVYKAAYAMQVL